MIMTGLLGPIPKAEYSHNAAWARLWAKLLKAEISPTIPDGGDVVLFFNINFDGVTLNLFGGLTKELFDRLDAFINSKATFSTVDHDMPDLGKAFFKRLENNTTYEKFSTEFLEKLTAKCQAVKTLRMTDFNYTNMIIGDSHSMSYATEDMIVSRNDGKTMNGICNDPEFIYSKIPDKIKSITLMFGSIDIRHHMFRLRGDPYENATKLLEKYKSLVHNLQQRGLSTTICCPVPIETEQRKMAETTKYKGQPFTGSREDRLKMTKFFIDYFQTNFENVISYPAEWYDMDPQEFEDTIMERPKSIHVGWPNFRINNFGVKPKTLENNLEDW